MKPQRPVTMPEIDRVLAMRRRLVEQAEKDREYLAFLKGKLAGIDAAIEILKREES